MVHGLLLFVLLWQAPASETNAGLYVRALQLVQTLGTPNAASPENDLAVKAQLAKGVLQDKVITRSEVAGLMSDNAFNQVAGSDEVMTIDEINAALDRSVPASRQAMLPKLRAHADYLATTFDMLHEKQLASAKQLALWIAKNYSDDHTSHVIIVCTGNSRRSMLGACTGNMAAAYYGLDKLQFHSGGTLPSAFNTRTINTLKEIGFEIVATGEEAERGDVKTANPKYRVTWGTGMETLEFSKRYSDESNPAAGFAAVMVCTEADDACPSVRGASLRLSMPFLDPKSYDDSQYEKIKYAERRDDIGRVFMAALIMASHEKNRTKN